MLSCNSKNENYTSDIRPYTVDISYSDNTARIKCRGSEKSLEPEKLYLFFETGYDSDTVSIWINKKKKDDIYISTNTRIGVAELIELDDINSINDFEISRNHGPKASVDLENKTLNKWAINFFRDTLKVTTLKYGPCYE
jgi:hypothetical protein